MIGYHMMTDTTSRFINYFLKCLITNSVPIYTGTSRITMTIMILPRYLHIHTTGVEPYKHFQQFMTYKGTCTRIATSVKTGIRQQNLL